MPTWLRVVGWILVVLVAGLMLFSAYGKITPNMMPDDIIGPMKDRLKEMLPIIAAGEALTAVLLLLPPTAMMGLILASSYWGGAIVFHMSHGDTKDGYPQWYVPAVLLAVTWLGNFLRNPRSFGFSGRP